MASSGWAGVFSSNPVLVVLVGATGPFSRVFVVHGATALLSLPTELPDDVEEGLFDVDTILGRGLDKITAEVLCQGLSFLGGDFAFGDAVALVAHKHDWRMPEHGG